MAWYQKQGDANAAQRGDGPKSQEINLPHMESNCQHEAEETTQTLNTSEKCTALFRYFLGSRQWDSGAISHTWAIFSSLLTLTPLPSQLRNLFS